MQQRLGIHKYFTGTLDRREYKKKHTEGYVELVEFMNNNMDSTDNAIFLYEARTYGINQTILSSYYIRPESASGRY